MDYDVAPFIASLSTGEARVIIGAHPISDSLKFRVDNVSGRFGITGVHYVSPYGQVFPPGPVQASAITAPAEPEPPYVPGAYSALVMAQAPRAYYRFNEKFGFVAVDSSGNELHATYLREFSLHRVAGLLTDETGTAYGSGGRPGARTNPVPGFRYTGLTANPNAAFTVTMLIAPTRPPEFTGVLIQLGNSGNGVPELSVEPDPLDSTRFVLRTWRSSIEGGLIYYSNVSWPWGTKLHVKLSKNGTALTLRVNKVQVGTATPTFGSNVAMTNIGFFANTPTGGAPDFEYAGVLDEVAIWDSFISDALTDAMCDAAFA